MIETSKRTKRTKQETIDYLRLLSDQFFAEAENMRKLNAIGNSAIASAKAEAYSIAAFEIERNME